MGSHCGAVGQDMCDNQRSRIEELWEQACLPAQERKARGSLPERCDRSWFLNTFCSGRELKTATKIWEHIDFFNVYSPMALLAALPGVSKRYLRATPVQVRAATHQVIGWSADQECVSTPYALQKLLLHLLLYGARCNVSEYEFLDVPRMSLASSRIDSEDVDYMQSEEVFDMSEYALKGIIPARSAYEWTY